jgi:phage gpG-like protein
MSEPLTLAGCPDHGPPDPLTPQKCFRCGKAPRAFQSFQFYEEGPIVEICDECAEHLQRTYGPFKALVGTGEP